METASLIASFLASRKLAGCSDATIQHYGFVLGRMARAIPSLPKTANYNLVRDFLSTYPGSLATLSEVRNITAAFLKWLREHYDYEDPMKRIPHIRVPEKQIQTLTNDEIFLVLCAPEKNAQHKALIYLLLNTGIRRGEAVSLKWKYLNTGGDFMYVTGKSGQRQVPISPEVCDLLLALPKGKDDYVFHSQGGPHTGKPLTEKGADYIAKKYLDLINFHGEKRGCHVFRHSFGRFFFEKTSDLHTLQKILGHKRIQQTTLYANLAWAPTIQKHHENNPICEFNNWHKKFTAISG